MKIKRGSLDLQEIDKEAVTLYDLIQIRSKKGMQEATTFLKSEGDELISSIDIEALDAENLKTLEVLIKMYQDVLRGDQELNKQIAKNQKSQMWIFFFFAVLFLCEIVYSLTVNSGYVDPVSVKALMIILILFLLALGYSVFRN